jgi:adenosylhomocysteinase
VIGIGYSGRTEVADALRAAGIRVIIPQRTETESVVRHELGRTLTEAMRDGVEVLIHEVGGTAVRLLHEDYPQHIPLVRGAVEITKQGVWEARKLPALRIAQWNCAETKLKELEGPFVGEAVVASMDQILRECGFCLAGREALVFGYGWVGRGVCHGLRNRGMAVVSAFDRDPLKQVALTLEGFRRGVPAHLGSLSLVVGAAGVRTLSADLLARLPHRCLLASGSSKCVEIDVDWLEANAVAHHQVHRFLQAFTMSDGRVLYLFNGGYPVNFTGPSVQDEIVEFLFAEALLLLDQAANSRNAEPGTWPLSVEREHLPAQVWLDLR